MKSHVLRATVLVVVSFSLCCANRRAWVYTPEPLKDVSAKISKKVVVMPFADERANVNRNRLAFYLIPLFPFGWVDYEVPEGEPMHIFSGLWTNYNPKEDYAKALAQELENARLFNEAYFGYTREGSDLVIRGNLENTRYKAYMITYGLSAYGPLLWFFGFPAGTASNELSVKLMCEDSKSRTVLFSKTYMAPRYTTWFWLYWMPTDFNYAELLKEIYREFIGDLERNEKKLAGAGEK
jgi:hypothetical protein